MSVFRLVVAALPQLLLLMLVGGRFDLLFGWNRTDSAFGVLIALFLVTPFAAAALLVVEIIRHWRQSRRDSGPESARSFRWVALAIFILLEALAVDLLVLSQMHMH